MLDEVLSLGGRAAAFPGGEVVRIISRTVPLSEPMPDDFTTANQVWRLAL